MKGKRRHREDLALVEGRYALVFGSPLPEMQGANIVRSGSERRHGGKAGCEPLPHMFSTRMSIPGRLQRNTGFTIPENSRSDERAAMKSSPKKPAADVSLNVWCEECRIRIAPSEAKIDIQGKSY